MSIACQSWEIGSGPTVGCCKAQAHQLPGDGLNFRNLLCRPEATAKFMQQQQHAQSFPPTPRLATTKADEAANAKFEVPVVLEAVGCSSSSSLITSSISNDSSADESDDKDVVESAFKGPLEQMDALMTTLPRRGLSKFYAGKSRSFTSLADVKSMPMKELSKPDNPYTKRRRLPVHREGTETGSKPRFPPPRMSNGISKKTISSNGTTLTLALAMSTKADQIDGDECAKRWQKSCRSLSLTDLQKA